MYAVSFDMDCSRLQNHFPSVPTAYAKVRRIMENHGFEWKQGSLYTLDSDDMAGLMKAIYALGSEPWFSGSVRDIRAFRVEQWSDFTQFVQSLAAPSQIPLDDHRGFA